MSAINDLRAQWLKELEMYDQLLKVIQAEGLAEDSEKDVKPVRLWVALIPKWRDELLQRLEDFPAEQ